MSRWASMPSLKVRFQGPRLARGSGGRPNKVREYVARVSADHENIHIDWVESPPEESRAEFEQDAAHRMRLRIDWLDSLTELMTLVKGWAEELDWSTKLIKKRLEDSEIGEYQASALLFQQELVRVVLEPISRSTPGGEAVVDLYLLPGYDDVASLYYYENRWHLNYLQTGMPSVGNNRQRDVKLLTKSSLRKVLDAMRNNAS
jgi:hypothetical protein